MATKVQGALGRAAQWVMNRTHGAGAWLSKSADTGWTIPHHYPWTWWQQDMKPHAGEYETFAPIYTSVAIISQDLSRIELRHVEILPSGERVAVTTKAPARIFRKPNSYQTRSDFLLYMMRSLLFDGNAYAIVGSRNARNEIESLYPVNPGVIWPHIEPTTGEYFYRLGADATTDIAGWDSSQTWLPARDVLHVRLFTPRHPLIGESPLVAALYPTISGTQINAHNAAFFTNMGRPSGILRHPGRLKPEAMDRIKQRWKELTSGPATGETAVLAEGMNWEQLQMTAVDAELAKSYALSERQIFQIFRVPPFLAADLDKATFTNVESLTRFYLQSCLGFYVDHIEEAMTLFFDLPPTEKILFDLEPALLRGDIKERMEAYGKAIQNGVYSPNEARAKENLPPAEDGDQPRVQQQLVPLSYGMDLEPPDTGSGSDSSSSSDEPSTDDTDDTEDSMTDEERALIRRSAANEIYEEFKQAI